MGSPALALGLLCLLCVLGLSAADQLKTRNGESSVVVDDKWFLIGGIAEDDDYPDIFSGDQDLTLGILPIEEYVLPSDFNSPTFALSPGIDRFGHVLVEYYNADEDRAFIYALGGSPSVSQMLDDLIDPLLEIVEFDVENRAWRYLQQKTQQVHFSSALHVYSSNLDADKIVFWPGVLRGQTDTLSEVHFFDLINRQFETTTFELPSFIPRAGTALEAFDDGFFIFAGFTDNVESLSSGIYWVNMDRFIADPSDADNYDQVANFQFPISNVAVTVTDDGDFLIAG